MKLAYIKRDEFLEHYWDYTLGEHVSFIEPTQGGKTHLMYQLLEATLPQYENVSVVSLMPKPKDPATRVWAERIGLKVIDHWPPPQRWPWQQKPPGYVLWPRHIVTDEAANREHLAGSFRPCLNDQYWHGSSVTLADDVYLAAVMLGLNMDLEKFWTAGGAQPAGLWSSNQKPSGTVGGGSVSSFSYNAPTHLFLGHDPDVRNQKRFSEIGGVDPYLVSEAVRGLRVHTVKTPQGPKHVSEKLYLRKGGPSGAYMCVVGL